MRLKGAFSPEDVCMPPTAEQGEPVGAAPVDEKLAETLEEIGTVDTFDVGQIHVSIYMAVMVGNGMVGMHVTDFGKG